MQTYNIFTTKINYVKPFEVIDNTNKHQSSISLNLLLFTPWDRKFLPETLIGLLARAGVTAPRVRSRPRVR